MRRRDALLAAGAVILAAMVVLAVQPVSAVLPVGLEARAEGGTVSVHYSAGAAQYLYGLTISVMPVDRPRELPGLVIVDANERAGASPAAAGLYDHLTTELHLRGADVNVTIVEASELDPLLLDPSAVLIICEPIARVNATAAELMGWVERGGLLICIGPGSLPFRQEIEDGNWTGPEGFLRIKYQELERAGEGMATSAYAEALSLRAVAPFHALDKGHLDNISAITVGYTYLRDGTELITAAMVPLGEGRLVLFGGGMRTPAMVSGDAAFAWDIVQMYLGGAFHSTAAPQHVSLPEVQGLRDGELSMTMDADAVVVMAYSDRDYVPAFGRTAVAAAS